MKSFLTLKSVDEVLSLVGTFEPLEEESVPLDECAGRSLARDWTAPEDLPGFDRSTVDGYAVRARDVFGARAELNGDANRGKLVIHYQSSDDLQRIWEMLELMEQNQA